MYRRATWRMYHRITTARRQRGGSSSSSAAGPLPNAGSSGQDDGGDTAAAREDSRAQARGTDGVTRQQQQQQQHEPLSSSRESAFHSRVRSSCLPPSTEPSPVRGPPGVVGAGSVMRKEASVGDELFELEGEGDT
mmetsp:Transcript_269/g.497  ORF Transcript_269/g.497 Transcript_269/m.497 type:complete len:135 (-) Transcript_269:223-627(-)